MLIMNRLYFVLICCVTSYLEVTAANSVEDVNDFFMSLEDDRVHPSDDPIHSEQTNIIVGITVPVCIVLLILIIVIVITCTLCYKHRRSRNHDNVEGTAWTTLDRKTHKHIPMKSSDLIIDCTEEGKLGQGKFGYVYKATLRDESYAVKILFDAATAGSDMSVPEAKEESFNTEVEILLTLEHPNIVKLAHVCFNEKKKPYLVMELLDCSLRKYFKSSCGVVLSDLYQISLCCDIAKGLAYLHENKVIHRDLCGDNILILIGTAIPLAKIADFGLSRFLNIDTMTQSLSPLGHRSGYLPPDEGESKKYDFGLDVFMFGAIMVQIVNAVEDITEPKHRQDLISNVRDGHPLKPFILSCVAESQTERPKSEQVSNELQNLFKKIKREELENNSRVARWLSKFCIK